MKQYFVLGSYTEPILFGTGEVFHGTGKGISICTFEDGKIEVNKELPVRNPSFLCISEAKKKIYAVNEMKEYQNLPGGGLTEISYDAEGNMQIEGSWNVNGTDPCHVALSPDETFLSIANFANGSVTVFSLNEDGSVKEKSQYIGHHGSSVHPVRQKGPHAHSSIFAPGEDLMYVPDLGMDRVVAYRYEKGKLQYTPQEDVAVPAGSGPRYGEFSRDGKHFYLINEISSQVMHFQVHPKEQGNADNSYDRMMVKDQVSTLPEDYKGDNICSDLHLTPNGRYLLASNRGHDSLVCYEIGQNGELAFKERISSGGKTPRNFAIDPTGEYIVVGNQDSDNITVFHMDESGHMTQISQIDTGSPVCIRFLKTGIK